MLAVLGIVLLAGGFFVSGTAQAAQRAALHRASTDPVATRPAQCLLPRNAERHPVLLAQWLAALGGIGLCPGLSVIMLTSDVVNDIADVHDGSAAVFAGLSEGSVLLTVLLVLLVIEALVWNVRSSLTGYGLRNAFVLRWPMRPDPKTIDDGKNNAGRVGPGPTELMAKEADQNKERYHR